MSLFKNGVGRPSNETLRKRKIAYVVIAVLVVVLLSAGGLLVYTFSKGGMSTSTKNITTKTLVYGDANGDEKTTIDDATTIQSFLAGTASLQGTYPKAADVDGDGKISENDATLIQKYLAKQVSKLPIKYGDVNGDDKIDDSDATLIQNYLVQNATLTAEQKVLADVDLDGSITAIDASKIQQYVAKTVTSLPVLGSNIVSKAIPAATTSTAEPTVKISAYKKGTDGKKTGKVLKTATNKNLEFTNWANYQYMMVVDAKAASGTIKSIKWEITSSQKATYKEANTTQSWKDGGVKTYSYDKASVTKELGINADGVRLGKITVTDSNGKSRTIKVRFNIDRTAPKLTFEIAGTKSGSGYVPGAQVTATCTDKLNGVTYMYTFDTQDKSDTRTYKGKATTTKSQTISLVSTGSARNITTTCKDALGNSTGAKKSNSYAIGYYGGSSNTTSNVINATISSVTCPSGYSHVGNGKCGKVLTYSYSCSDGGIKQGDGPSATCIKTVAAIRDSYYSCSSPFEVSGNKCTYTKSATRNCKTGTYNSSSGMCRTYKRAAYNSKTKKYTCPIGYRISGSDCFKETNPTYTCPTAYGLKGTVSGTKCVYTKSASVSYGKYRCTYGKLQGTKCITNTTYKTTKTPVYTYKNATKITYKCPSGYNLKNTNKCYKK